jgi:hypothetical protein
MTTAEAADDAAELTAVALKVGFDAETVVIVRKAEAPAERRAGRIDGEGGGIII